MKQLIIIPIYFLALTLHAQDTLTLDEAIRIALQNNFSIQLSKNEADIAANNNNLGNAGFFPTLDLTGSVSESINNSDQKYLSGDEVQKTGAKNFTGAAGAALNWTLFNGFTMFITRNQLNILQQSGLTLMRQNAENTISLVMTGYSEIVHERNLLDALQQQYEISKFRKELLDTRFSVGNASKIEAQKALVDMNGDQYKVIQQQAVVEKTKVRLNELLSREVSTSFTVDTAGQLITDFNYEKLQQDMVQNNSALELSDQNIQLATLDIQQTRALHYPVLAFNGGYNFLQSQSESGFVTFNRNQGFFYGLSASLNVFNGFNVMHQQQNNKISLMSRQLEKEQTQLSLQSGLKQLYLDYLSNLQLIALEEENLEYAQQNLDIAQESFRLGVLSDLELREIQRNLIDAKVRLNDATFQAQLKQADLMRITGNLVKEIQ